MRTTLAQFRWPIIFTLAGLCLAFWLGCVAGGTGGGLSFVMIGTALAALEISLSFDNAIVNATVLRGMTPVWQRRFLTWGILIAVFGMRILFPLLVVAIAGGVGPGEALHMAVMDHHAYARMMHESHLSIAAFGGTFLMMVALGYFIDEQKDVHWIDRVECRLRACASARGLEIAFVLVVILGFASFLSRSEADTFMIAAIAGLVTFSLVKTLGRIVDCGGEESCVAAGGALRTEAEAEADGQEGEAGPRRDTGAALVQAAARGGIGAFLYLEVLDASFSFDGVIGAFAMTENLLLIAIGLGIGAFYVRAMTMMLVEKGTLSQFRYLEHGAFYSILALSVVMFVQTQVEISEMITGTLGVGLIGLSLWSSIRYNRRVGEA